MERNLNFNNRKICVIMDLLPSRARALFSVRCGLWLFEHVEFLHPRTTIVWAIYLDRLLIETRRKMIFLLGKKIRLFAGFGKLLGEAKRKSDEQ